MSGRPVAVLPSARGRRARPHRRRGHARGRRGKHQGKHCQSVLQSKRSHGKVTEVGLIVVLVITINISRSYGSMLVLCVEIGRVRKNSGGKRQAYYQLG